MRSAELSKMDLFKKNPHTSIMIKTTLDVLDSPDGREYTHHHKLIFRRIV